MNLFSKKTLCCLLLLLAGNCFAVPADLTPEAIKALSTLSNSQKQQLSQSVSLDKEPPLSSSVPVYVATANPEPAELSVIERLFSDKELVLEFNVRAQDPSFISSSLSTKPSVNTLIKSSKSIERQSVTQFGYDLFKLAKNASFVVSDFPVGKDYVLGPGDSLVIRIGGKIEETLEVTIDSSGRVSLPKVGYVGLTGLSVDRATSVLQRELEKFYVNFQVAVTLSRLRSIKVFVLGDVAHPGAYDMSSFSTAITALYAAGGPTRMGSLRKIQIKKANRSTQTMDLYQYLLRGDRRQDARLEANDTIFVPPIGEVVKISGIVKRPGIYEMNDTTNLYDALLGFSGGLPAGSYQKRVQVRRIESGEKQKVIDLTFASAEDLRQTSQRILLMDGDQITILPLSGLETNVVTIEGNVRRSGKYQLKPGMTLSSLIQQAEGLKEETFLSRIEILRFISESQREILTCDFSRAANFALKERDIVKVLSESDVVGDSIVEIRGAVQQPGQYKLLKNMRVSDLIYSAKLDHFQSISAVELFRKNTDRSDTLIAINLKHVLETPVSTENIVLQNQDRLFVRYDNSIQLRRIILSGEVKYPGVYLAKRDETLQEIIVRAGGYTPSAFPQGAVLKRDSVKLKEINVQSRVLDEERKRLIYDQGRLASLSEKNQGLYQEALQFLKDKISESSERIILSSSDNPVMEDGDSYSVPSIPSAIRIIGGVQQPSAVIFTPNQPISYYIDKVGGYSEFASKESLYVIKANGNVDTHATTIELGDTIYVPERIKVYIDWVDAVQKSVQFLFNIVIIYKLLFVL